MLDKLFDNIGAKIKTLAKWTFIVEAVSAIITGITLLFDEYILAGLLTLFCGPIVAWVSSWILYGFGELVESTCTLRQQNAELRRIEQCVQVLAEPSMLKCAEEKATREAEAAAKRAEEKTKREAEAAAKQAEEDAKREAEEQAKREAAARAKALQQRTTPKEKTLWEKLEYSLQYHTDDGMISYLSDLDDSRVKEILSGPRELIREKTKTLAEQLKKEA